MVFVSWSRTKLLIVIDVNILQGNGLYLRGGKKDSVGRSIATRCCTLVVIRMTPGNSRHSKCPAMIDHTSDQLQLACAGASGCMSTICLLEGS